MFLCNSVDIDCKKPLLSVNKTQLNHHNPYIVYSIHYLMKNKILGKRSTLNGNYLDKTDKYFPRSRDILKAAGVNPIVRYQVFVRKDIGNLRGVDEGVDFIGGEMGDKAQIYALRNGQEYFNGEPILKIEGRAQDLMDLETMYLSITSGALTGPVDLGALRVGARAIYKAAEGKPVYDFSARHFAPELIPEIARICQEEGFAGTSTDAGAKAWGDVGLGTTPHALFLTYKAYMEQNGIEGNPTIEAAKAFDKYVERGVSRTFLGCTFNRELSDIVDVAKAGIPVSGTRIDTCGENYTEGSLDIELPELDILEKYKQGRGVSIASVWGLRKGLDDADLGSLGLFVSSGFNAEKTAAFVEADKVYQEMHGKALFDAIGTGSFGMKNLVMTTSDICAYFDENKGLWVPNSKVGRAELLSDRLEERL